MKNKKLNKEVESALLKQHKKCESEAKTTFGKKEQVIEMVQLYQACVSIKGLSHTCSNHVSSQMDFHITETCGIKVTPPQ